MTKTQFIESLAQQTGLSKADCGKMLDGLAEVVEKLLKAGEAVTLPGLAKFAVKEKAAQPAKQKMNPFTKQMMTVAAKPASKKITVKPIAALKKSMA